MRKLTFLAISMLMVLSIVLSACGQATPETIIQTVVVEKEGETVIENEFISRGRW